MAGKKEAAAQAEVVYTYDVKWEYSEIKWASRWDLYLYMGDDQIHWFSIINSLAIVLLLTGIVAMIMMRTLRRDFNRYNEQDKEDLQAAARSHPNPNPNPNLNPNPNPDPERDADPKPKPNLTLTRAGDDAAKATWLRVDPKTEEG